MRIAELSRARRGAPLSLGAGLPYRSARVALIVRSARVSRTRRQRKFGPPHGFRLTGPTSLKGPTTSTSTLNNPAEAGQSQ